MGSILKFVMWGASVVVMVAECCASQVFNINRGFVEANNSTNLVENYNLASSGNISRLIRSHSQCNLCGDSKVGVLIDPNLINAWVKEQSFSILSSDSGDASETEFEFESEFED